MAAAGCDGEILVVHAERPLGQSIESLVRRCPNRRRETLAAHQRWLDEGKREILAGLPAKSRIDVPYDQLLSDPLAVARRIAKFARIEASESHLELRRPLGRPRQATCRLGESDTADQK